jgi:predicted MFS family arabinose efflux permease
MHPLGIEGWRFVFLTVALVSVTIGIATFFLSHDPRFDSDTEVSHSAEVANALYAEEASWLHA